MNDSERIASRIKGIIDNNSQDIAFIIGNGIHRYAESLNKAEYISWNDLLIKLSEGLYEEVPSGISNTEFFDIIELHNLKRLKEKQRKDAEEFLRNGFHLDENAQFLLNKKPLNKLLLSSLNKQLDTYLNNKSVLQLKPSQNLKKLNIRELPIFKEPYNTMIMQKDFKCLDNMREALLRYGIPETEVVYDLKFAAPFLFQRINSDYYLKSSLACYTKKKIKERMVKWKSHPIARNIVTQIKNLKATLLTTNYDEIFSNSVKATFHKMDSINDNGYKFSDFYPWNCYYGDELYLPTSGFGIWHINGMIRYHRSISLGLIDYMRNVSKASTMIGGPVFEFDSFLGNNQINWKGNNTWLNVFLNKSLFIFGLSLDENETFLRWLLIQRAKYFSSYGEEHKGWYVFNRKEEKLSEGKKVFLESVGFEIIEIEDYKTIYEDIWQ